jgi:hypothetical protein
MTTLKIVITTEDGTVLDSTEVQLTQPEIDNPVALRLEVKDNLDDINWNRISNLLGSED